MSRARLVLIGAAVLCLVLALLLFWPEDDGYVETREARAPTAEDIERGRILSALGNCQACHTERGGEPFAGGRAIPTSFGTFYAPNITPDETHGIGRWSERDFWRALHRGRSADGTLLYPAFPYPNYTRITQDDARALYLYLRTVKPVARADQPHELRFPYNQRSLLRAWRWLYFRPGVFEPDATQSAQWNRGAYIVEGVGHCDYCHAERDSLGGVREGSGHPGGGGNILGWYAPSLQDPHGAGMQQWSIEATTDLLQSGRSASSTAAPGATLGPMAEVVFESLQHVPREDIEAMAVYLKSLPESGARDEAARPRVPTSAAAALERGRVLYEKRCASCHGDSGEGRLPAAIALANNRAVTLSPAVNVIRVVLYGGYPPGTKGNPQPFGMPPFSQDLSDAQIADVVNFIRTSWGNAGSFISANDVARARTGPIW
jgi:mono/diheme cytochrome c family protein